MTDDVALVAGFTPEWVLVLEDPGITAVPEPYYTGRYLDGVEVTLTATPPEGYHLSGWTGHLSGTVNPETLEMDGNKAVGAVYAKDGHTITVACDGDEGSVSVYLNESTTPETGVSGVYDVEWGDAVRLVAAPVVDEVNGVYYRFAEWTDVPGNPATAEAFFTVTGNLSVAAAFQQQYLVTLGVTGAGNAWISSGNPAQDLLRLIGDGTQPGPTASAFVDEGTVLTAHAQVDTQAGSAFDYWMFDGSAFAVGPELSLGACTDHLEVTALFEQPYTLDVSVYPTSAPATVSVDCLDGEDCQSFELSAAVSASARGWRFTRWARWDGTEWEPFGYHPEREVTLSGSLVLRAEFEEILLPYDLNAFRANTRLAVSWAKTPTAALTFSEPCAGFQVPDVISMTLVDWTLKTPYAPLHAETRAAFFSNVEALNTVLDDYIGLDNRPPASEVNAVASAAVYSAASFQTFYASLVWTQCLDRGAGGYAAFWLLLRHAPQMTTLSDLSACADVDGDGFSNVEEWLYYDWSHPGIIGGMTEWPADEDPEGFDGFFRRWALYSAAMEYGDNGNVPDIAPYANTPGAPPTVTVSIARDGDGGSVYPAPGTYQLPKYHLTDWWTGRDASGNYIPRADQCAPCAAAALTLNTAPGNGRYFKRFDGAPKGVFEDPDYTPFEEDGTEYRFTSPTNVPLSQNSAVSAVFSVDLVRSLGLFLVALGELTDPAAVEGSTYDGNDCHGPGSGNGMPDVVEFAFLDAVMHDPRVDLGLVGGIVQATAHAAYWENHARAAEELGAEAAGQYPWLVETMAAYMTIGGWDVPAFVRSVVLEITGLEIEATGYNSSQNRHLDPQADADNDGVTNLEEWEMGGSLFESLLERMARMLDPELDDMPEPEPLDSLHCWNDDLSAPGPGSGYLRMDQGGMAFRAWVKLEPGGKGIELTHDQLTGDDDQDIIRAGRIIELRVKPDQDEVFHYWDIPGTLADGSTKKRVEFTFNTDTGNKSAGGANFFALAVPRPRGTLLVPEASGGFAYTAEPSGPFADQVNVSTDAQGRTVYDAPFGTRFRVSVTSPPELPVPFGLHIHGGNGGTSSHSSSATVTLPFPVSNGELTLDSSLLDGQLTDGYISLRPPNVPHAVSTIGRIHELAIFGGSFLFGNPPIAASSVALYCVPEPGYYLDGWVGASGTPSCSSPWQGLTVTESATVPGRAVKPCTTLDVRVEIIDSPADLHNAGKAAAGGLVVADDAKTFYEGENVCPTFREGEVVRLCAEARCGYVSTGWTGSEDVYTSASGSSPYVVSGDPAKLSSNTPLRVETIYVVTNSDMGIRATFMVPRPAIESVEAVQTDSVCFAAGFRGRIYTTYSTSSNTGQLEDLHGWLFEVLAYDASSTLEDIRVAVNSTTYSAICNTKQMPLSTYPADIPIPWNSIFKTPPPRLEKWGGHDPRNTGSFPDDNQIEVPCSFATCYSSDFVVRQYFVYYPACGLPYILPDCYSITRRADSGTRSVSIAKHGTIVQSNCGIWNGTCGCI